MRSRADDRPRPQAPAVRSRRNGRSAPAIAPVRRRPRWGVAGAVAGRPVAPAPHAPDRWPPPAASRGGASRSPGTLARDGGRGSGHRPERRAAPPGRCPRAHRGARRGGWRAVLAGARGCWPGSRVVPDRRCHRSAADPRPPRCRQELPPARKAGPLPRTMPESARHRPAAAEESELEPESTVDSAAEHTARMAKLLVGRDRHPSTRHHQVQGARPVPAPARRWARQRTSSAGGSPVRGASGSH